MSYLTATDIDIYSGDSLNLQVTVTDSTTNLPKSLIGVLSARWWFGKKAGQPATVQKSIGSGVTIIDAINGRLDILINPSDTASLKGSYVHELELVDASNRVQTVMAGAFTIIEDLVV